MEFESGIMSDTTSQSASFNSASKDFTAYNFGSVMVHVTCTGVNWNVCLQGSNDDVSFANIDTPTTFTDTSHILLKADTLSCRYYRLRFVRTSGTLTSETSTYCAKQ